MKLRLKGFRINFFELIYLTLFAVYVFASIIDVSLLSLGVIKTLINYVSIGCLAALFVSKQSPMRHLRICMMLAVFVIAAFATDRLYIIVYMMFLITARYSSLRRIMNVSFVMTGVSVLLVVLCCKANIIPDLVYKRDGVESAHSYGFGHYSSISYFTLYMTLIWMYLRNKTLRYFELLCLVGVNFAVFKLTTTRLTMYLILFTLAMYVVIEKLDLIRISAKWVVALSSIGFAVSFILCIVMDIAYDPLKADSNSFLYKVDTALNSRLSMGHKALTEYSPKLLGQKIEMVGQKTAVFGSGHNEYFYIDSGYIYALLGYGILFTAVMLTLYTIILRKTAQTENTVLFVWTVSVMLFTIVNNAWISIAYNPLLFYIVLPEGRFSYHRLIYTIEKKLKIKLKT